MAHSPQQGIGDIVSDSSSVMGGEGMGSHIFNVFKDATSRFEGVCLESPTYFVEPRTPDLVDSIIATSLGAVIEPRRLFSIEINF